MSPLFLESNHTFISPVTPYTVIVRAVGFGTRWGMFQHVNQGDISIQHTSHHNPCFKWNSGPSQRKLFPASLWSQCLSFSYALKIQASGSGPFYSSVLAPLYFNHLGDFMALPPFLWSYGIQALETAQVVWSPVFHSLPCYIEFFFFRKF